MVQGGIIGQSYNEKTCKEFDETHSKFLNMKIDVIWLLT